MALLDILDIVFGVLGSIGTIGSIIVGIKKEQKKISRENEES